MNPARTRWRNTTCCTTLRCRGVTSASSQRAETMSTDEREPKVRPVIQFDDTVAGTHQGQPHLDFMVGTDRSTGAAWASTVLIKGKEDPHIVSPILSWLSELGHSNSGHPVRRCASEVVMRMAQSEGAMMENPPCEIIQQQSQRYSHQSNGGAQRMVQSTRNHMKAYKIQFEKNSGITNHSRQSSAHLVTTTRNMAMHAIPQTTRLYNNNNNNNNKPFSLKSAPFLCRLYGMASAVDMMKVDSAPSAARRRREGR